MATTKRNRKASAPSQTARKGAKSGAKAPSPTKPRSQADGALPSTQKASSRRGKTATRGAVGRSNRTQRSVAESRNTAFRDGTKGHTIVTLLKRRDGATIAELVAATGWQAHSVRGFLSGSLKKKLGIAIASEKDADGQRRYRIA